jgi:dTMP kinase
LVHKESAPGKLLSLELVEGRTGLTAARKLLKSRSVNGGISTWDASSIFFEMHNLEVNDRPSPRTLILLYAADLFFRLRWEIKPALKEGKCVVAVPYVETGFALGQAVGLPKKWLTEVFRFAPKPDESFHVNGQASTKLGGTTTGFVEFCSDMLSNDLRPKFAAYFHELERHGRCARFNGK